MSGENENCREQALRCKCTHLVPKFSANMPTYYPSFEEISKQMKINVEILKKEISEHIDKEIERLKKYR
jgi:hypothetical protein